MPSGQASRFVETLELHFMITQRRCRQISCFLHNRRFDVSALSDLIVFRNSIKKSLLQLEFVICNCVLDGLVAIRSFKTAQIW